MSSSKDIFTKVTVESEKHRIFNDIALQKSQILAKTLEPLSEASILRAELIIGNELCCEVIASQGFSQKNGEFILQINLAGEKYLCTAPFEVRGTRTYIKTNVDLFHLQRRDDFRLKLPTSYHAYFNLNKVNQTPIQARLKIIDLSGGGCKIMVQTKTPHLTVNDLVSGSIELPDRPAILIQGQIRHETDDQHSQVAGIQFIGLSLPVKNRLVALVMDLYRQLFSRLV
jgi:hypothetical protein